jgi:hypothetical protein
LYKIEIVLGKLFLEVCLDLEKKNGQALFGDFEVY